MRAVVQRVNRGKVTVAQETVGEIKEGLLVLLGVGLADNTKDAGYIADKLASLRIFEDSAGKMNLSVAEVGGELHDKMR